MKLAIFDLDGTLVNSLEDITDAVNYTMKQLGCPERSISEVNSYTGDGLLELCQKALPENEQDKLESAIKIYSEYYNSHYTVKTKPYDGIPELLHELKERGIVLAVASNKTYAFTVDIIFKCFGRGLFSEIEGRIDGRPIKPAPDIIDTILKKTGFMPEDAVLIGDTGIDITTAVNAGIRSAGCLWGFRTREELEGSGADFIVGTPCDILSLIDSGVSK